jgi:hypothetical protein
LEPSCAQAKAANSRKPVDCAAYSIVGTLVSTPLGDLAIETTNCAGSSMVFYDIAGTQKELERASASGITSSSMT